MKNLITNQNTNVAGPDSARVAANGLTVLAGVTITKLDGASNGITESLPVSMAARSVRNLTNTNAEQIRKTNMKESKVSKTMSAVDADNDNATAPTKKKTETKAGAKVIPQPAAETEAEKAATSKDKVVYTAADKDLLKKQESVIESNIGAFLLLGEALSVIKERDLQKASDPKLNFDEYCSKKWGFGHTYAYRLINGYQCVEHLKVQMAPNGVTMFPTNEAQVRPLTGMKPEEQVAAWTAVLKKANGGTITAAMVEEVVDGAVETTAKPETTAETKPVQDKAEHKTLQAIAKLVEKAKQVDPAELNLKKLMEIINKIEKLLKGEES